MSKSKPVYKGITLDRSKLLGFDQLSRSASDPHRAKLRDVCLLTKVGGGKTPAPRGSMS